MGTPTLWAATIPAAAMYRSPSVALPSSDVQGGAVADLDDRRRLLGLRRQHDGLHLLEGIGVEGSDGEALTLGAHQPGQGVHQAHGTTPAAAGSCGT